MKISVIIPTYKPKDYIWQCLNSLINQTFPKEYFEIILVLNGCTEPWKGLIGEYISKNMKGMNINFIHTEQDGVSNARNLALDIAKGEYITFIDDDDYVSPQYLEELFAKASPDTISICYPYAFNDGEDSIQLPYIMTTQYNEVSAKGKQPYPRARKFFSGPCMKLIPMSFIQGRRYDPNFKNGEDSLFMFLISDKFKWVDFTSEKAVYYRRFRENSATTIKRSRVSKFNNSMKMIWKYTKIYISLPFKYDLFFYITRILGTFRSVL